MRSETGMTVWSSLALLIARLYAGGYLLQTGTTQLSRGYLSGGGLMPQLQRFLATTPHEWYRTWLTQVVIPHEHLFAVLVAIGQTAVAIALLLGALTRLSALVGVFMVANFLFAKGFWNPAAMHDKDFIVLLLVLLFAGGGRWALDRWLWRGR